MEETPQDIAKRIYNCFIISGTKKGEDYKYWIPLGLTMSFVDEVITTLHEKYLFDDVFIFYRMGYITIRWS